MIGGNCKDEDDDIFSSRNCPKSKSDWKHPLRTDDTAVAATLQRHRGERSHVRYRRETAPPTRCNSLPPRFWTLEYGAIAQYPHSLMFHPLAQCPHIPVEQTLLDTFNLSEKQKPNPVHGLYRPQPQEAKAPPSFAPHRLATPSASSPEHG